MQASALQGVADHQRRFFRTGPLMDVGFRVEQLRRLARAIEAFEPAILDALRKDLGKPETEAYLSEIAFVLREVAIAARHAREWARAERVKTPLFLLPGASFVYPDPYGSVLILAPWNYPFQLTMSPLIGAMAAGNCAVVKPSEVSAHTAKVIEEMIQTHFPPEYVRVANGGVDITQALLAQHFDYIFFTGSQQVGRIVMAAAARHLTPVTLELGGKNPCIVDADIDVAKAARRIAVGKYINAGQTCIAPDYVLAHARVKPALLDALRSVIEATYGSNPAESPDYARIINDRHFARLQALLTGGTVAIGGGADAETRYIAPTVLDGAEWTHAVMQEEIFGPILPVLAFDELSDVIHRLHTLPQPLALYLFSNTAAHQRRVLREVLAGGVCINDTLGLFENDQLPFGGLGNSGMGAYHGKASFDTFAHKKGVFRGTWVNDLRILHPPYRTSLKALKRMLRIVS